jgi:hypothetical protein
MQRWGHPGVTALHPVLPAMPSCSTAHGTDPHGIASCRLELHPTSALLLSPAPQLCEHLLTQRRLPWSDGLPACAARGGYGRLLRRLLELARHQPRFADSDAANATNLCGRTDGSSLDAAGVGNSSRAGSGSGAPRPVDRLLLLCSAAYGCGLGELTELLWEPQVRLCCLIARHMQEGLYAGF